jgi:PAS domain S-box-containing protein
MAMDGFLLVDLAGRFLEVNDAYCRMTGYSRPELLQMDIAQVEAMESPIQVEEHIKKVIDDHGDFFETIRSPGERHSFQRLLRRSHHGGICQIRVQWGYRQALPDFRTEQGA